MFVLRSKGSGTKQIIDGATKSQAKNTMLSGPNKNGQQLNPAAGGLMCQGPHALFPPSVKITAMIPLTFQN